SKIEADRMDLDLIEFDVEQLVETAVDVAAFRAADRGIELIVDIGERLPGRVVGDPKRLGQIMMNLVDNAVKFTEQGHVLVSVEAAENSTASEPHLRFTVADTGIGLAAEKIQAVMDPFIQVDSSTTREHGGTGLGLAISRKLVELMGGELRIASEIGVGSTFAFDLTLGPAEDTVAEGAASLPDDGSAGTALAQPCEAEPIRILFVEDSEINRTVVLGYLRGTPHDVVVAHNGQQAVAEFRAAGPNGFDLVLMDMQMPVMDGYDATREIRRLEESSGQGPRARITALTAYAMADEAKVAYEAGCDEYLVKPIKKAVLLEAIARHAQER
ncbi:MAG: ATP-binding protein, partial [Actinomycetes bacterium]